MSQAPETTYIEPPRIKNFRLEIVKAIPRFPNDKATLIAQQAKSLGSIMIDYFSWRARFVGIRPRSVAIEPAAKSDPRWIELAPEVDAFLEKVERGDDLTPHLSLEPHTRGYTPAAGAPGASTDEKWLDKDFLLTAMGYHHFHLGLAIEPAGHAARTDDLIFAKVTRDEFTVVAIFDHSVFDTSSCERKRLWKIHDDISLRGIPRGAVLISNPIMTSGHSFHVVNYAQHCARLVRDNDPLIDDPRAVERWFSGAKLQMPRKPKCEWSLFHLDVGVYEKNIDTFLCLQKGWN